MAIRRNINKNRPVPAVRKRPLPFLSHTWFSLGKTAARIYSSFMFKLDVVYKAELPDGAKVLASNHPNTLDPVLMTTLVREPVSILILDTLFKVPLLGRSLKFSGHIRVESCRGQAALDEGVQRLHAGHTVGIFPEGIISPRGGGLHHFHSGAARLAVAGRVPIVPVGIAIDPDYMWRTLSRVDGRMEVGSWYIHGPYAVTVGEPMLFEGNLEDRVYIQSVTTLVQNQIAVLTLESARRIRAARRNLLSTRVIETIRFLWMYTRGAFRAI